VSTEPAQDPQDNAFGVADNHGQDSSRDDGVTANQISDAPTRRSGGKVEPGDVSAENVTGERKAQQNREEEPPA
jgi:hypothetical protein